MVEVPVDVIPEIDFDVRDLNVELDVILIKETIMIIKKLVVLLLKVLDSGRKLVNNWLNPLKVVLLEFLELLNGAKEFL